PLPLLMLSELLSLTTARRTGRGGVGRDCSDCGCCDCDGCGCGCLPREGSWYGLEVLDRASPSAARRLACFRAWRTARWCWLRAVCSCSLVSIRLSMVSSSGPG